jgi:uncharacterized membrane protein
MGWLLYAFLTAICEAAKDIFSKIGLKTNNVYIVAWAYRLYSLPFLLPLLFFIDIPQLSLKYWMALFVGGSLNVLTSILYMKAIKHADLSVSVPLVTFTPLFLLLTSPLIVGEFPSLVGALGIVAIVLGSYLLNYNQNRRGIWAPFKALVSEKGPRYMLLVAFIWSITSNIDKIGIKSSSPIFWAITVSIFISIAMIPVILVWARGEFNQIITSIKRLAPIGLFSALTLIFQMLAINLALVAYVIAIKRTSAILVVLVGLWFFKERDFKYRLIGSSVMVFGVILISFF